MIRRLLAIYAVAMAGGVATAFDNPARRSFVVEMVPTTHVQNAVSLNSALMTSARVIGPPIAGLLIVTSGYGWCFAIDGLTYIAVLVAYWRMNTDEIVRSESAPQAKGQIREGLRYVRSEIDLFVPLVMTAHHRHVRDELPGRLPAVRQGEPGRHGHDVHDPVLGGRGRRRWRQRWWRQGGRASPIAMSCAGRCCSA